MARTTPLLLGVSVPALAFTDSPWAAVLVGAIAVGLVGVLIACAVAIVKVKRQFPDATVSEVAEALAEVVRAVLRGRRDR